VDTALAKEALESERARMAFDLERLQRSLGTATSGSGERLDSGLDDAVATFSSELDEGLMDELRGTLNELDAALARIVAGTYGECVECRKAIPDARLAALPASSCCIDCQRRAEHG